MLEPKGIIAAMSTPFFEDEPINEAEIRNQAKRMMDAGIDGLFCLGTNGEFYALSQDEKIRVMEILTDEVAGKVPVYAGTGAITTRVMPSSTIARVIAAAVTALSMRWTR